MTKVSKSILKGAREALAYANGKKLKARSHTIEIPKKIDVKAIRQELNMDRKEFCETFGFKIRTLEKWEQGERCPEQPTRAYLIVIANNPQAVVNALEMKI